MKNRRRQRRVRRACCENVGEMIRIGVRPARRDDGQVRVFRHQRGQFQIEPLLRAVSIHGCQQNLARAQRFDLFDPIEDFLFRFFPPRIDDDIKFAVETFGVNGDDDALRPEFSGRFGDQIGIRDRRRVQRHLVRPRQQQRADVVDGTDAAADRERDEHLARDAFHHVQRRFPAVVRRGDVQKNQLVRPLLRIFARQFDGIARVFQVFKVDAFDGLSVLDIQTGNDAFCQHGVLSFDPSLNGVVTGLPAFFGVELRRRDVAGLHGRGERDVIVRRRGNDGRVVANGVIGIDEIIKIVAQERIGGGRFDPVPPDLRHFSLREADVFAFQQPQPLDAGGFLGRIEQHLQPDANPQKRDALADDGAQRFGQSLGGQRLHDLPEMALPRKDQPSGVFNVARAIRQLVGDGERIQHIDDAFQIAAAVVQNHQHFFHPYIINNINKP